MNEVIRDYMVKSQIEFDNLRREIDDLKSKFKSTNWTDERSMISAAGEIWSLESRLKDYMEQHKIILENSEGA